MFRDWAFYRQTYTFGQCIWFRDYNQCLTPSSTQRYHIHYIWFIFTWKKMLYVKGMRDKGTVTTSGNHLAYWRPLVAKGHHGLICVHMCLCCLCVPSPVPHCDLCSHLFSIVCPHLSCILWLSLLLISQGTNTWSFVFWSSIVEVSCVFGFQPFENKRN